MRKINGTHLDPFFGDCRHNGIVLGEVVAKLHQALSDLTIEQGVYDGLRPYPAKGIRPFRIPPRLQYIRSEMKKVIEKELASCHFLEP